MIVKSMARKEPSFRQLVDYFHKDAHRRGRLRKGASRPDPGLVFARNLYGDAEDRAAVALAFEANYRFLPKRRNGNALYHEIIVLEQEAGVPKERQADILMDLAERYCAMRAPDQLAYGRIHQDRDHQHIHLMISANAVRSKRRVRLPKARFAEIQRDLEAFKLERFPELAPLRVYTLDAAERQAAKTRAREQAATERTGRPSQKQAMADRIGALIAASRSEAELGRALAAEGLALYRRGKMLGVEDRATGKRHRLKTLGLETAFAEMTRAKPEPTPQREQAAEPPMPQPRRRPSPDRPAPGRDSAPVREPRAEALLRNRRGRDAEPERAPPQTTEPVDSRAADLLRRRALEREARDRLDGFDRDER